MHSKLIVVEPKFELITPVEQIKDMMRILEICGRTCYKSEDKITADSAEKFIRMIIKRGHESVLEHCVITGRFIGSRSMSHQLVRHRIAAFSQESQRYCNYGKSDALQIIVPPEIGQVTPGEYEQCGSWPQRWIHTNGEEVHLMKNEKAYKFMTMVSLAYSEYLDSLGYSRTKPEDARELLPNATKTEVCTTFNLRMWRHFFKERAFNAHAQWQIKKIALQAYDALVEHLPAVFDDLDLRDGNGNG